jgi:hypothetical protein
MCLVSIQPSADDEKKYADEQSLRQEERKAATKIYRLNLIGTVIGAFGLLFLFWTLKATKQSADAATKAADLAEGALKASAEQFRVDERPYLIKEYMRLAAPPKIGSRLAGEVLWKNTGKTPAINGGVYLRIDVLDQQPNSLEEWMRLSTQAVQRGEMGSGLGRSTPVVGDNPLSAYWYERISRGKSKLYIFGAFSYQDMFGANDWHVTYACAVYQPGSVNELYLWSCEKPETNALK